MIVPLPKPEPGRRAVRPKLAATIVLLREDDGVPKILMGKRSHRHDFMPSVYVFPGGRVDRGDSIAPACDKANGRTQNILQSAMPSARARACILAAVRETFEETSLILGAKSKIPPSPVHNSSRVHNSSWTRFQQKGYLPAISGIEVFGRAVTPPHRNKRFDTWFFLARLNNYPHAGQVRPSDELVDVGWFSLKDIAKLDTHRATQMMFEQLKIYLAFDNPPPDIFYSRAVHGKFKFSRFPQ